MKIKILIICVLFFYSFHVSATCVLVRSTTLLSQTITDSGYTASKWTGTNNSTGRAASLGLPSIVALNSSNTFEPAGTLLASSVTNPIVSGNGATPYTANQILFRCELADANSLYEIYGTNSSYKQTGGTPTTDVTGAYNTAIRYVAMRFTNNATGLYYTNLWQGRKLTATDWVTDDQYIYIPASAFSDVTVELLKTDTTTGSSNSANSYKYTSAIDQALVTMQGPGLYTSDLIGKDLGDQHPNWGTNGSYPIGYSMYGITFTRSVGCGIKDYPSVVTLPEISLKDISTGSYTSTTFDVSLSCSTTAVSGVTASTSSKSYVAMGFLVTSANAVTQATNMNLTSDAYGLTYLLDSNYGNSGVASGVGIQISDQNNRNLILIGTKKKATGNAGGWYAYKDITTSQNDAASNIITYTGSFTATLKAIPSQTQTAGTVNAQLQVIVEFQ